MNYAQAIRQELEANKTNKTQQRTASIPAKRYNKRSRAQAKQYRIASTTTSTHTSTSTNNWEYAPDTNSSYEDMEAAFWS